MARTPFPSFALLPLLVAALLQSLPTVGAPLLIKRRGAQLRTELVRTVTKPSFRWRLAPSPDSFPRLLFEGIDLVTLHQAHIYQAVMEVPRGGGEPDGPRIEYKDIPGEVIRGEEFTRRTSEITGPLANTSFIVNGVTMVTDDAGVATDTSQSLLALFEDLAASTVTVAARNDKAGLILLTVSRHVLKRYNKDMGPPGSLPKTDLLASMGLDFEPKRSSEREGVTMAVTVPDKLKPGQSFNLTLTVTNRGRNETSSFLGRTVSGRPWLHGKLFYIGSVPSGTSLAFTRHFTVPEDANGGVAFGGMTYWDLLGTLKDKGTVLKLPIDGPPRSPAKPKPEPAP
ncbi:MAG: hypothetical protein HN849_17490 [Victivallales bacterium]|nr:hypothetical protein [Victivallales bacterium]MBT7301320.1 hypothetical protein [Victivallales bacterium]